jgi:tetratricopeptide (TPR) repeat protein
MILWKVPKSRYGCAHKFKTHVLGHSKDMDDFFEILDGLFEKGNTAEIEAFLKDYDASLAREGAGGELRRVSVLNELGGFLRGVSRYAESERCFADAASILERHGLSATEQYATTVMNLAGTYRLEGKFDLSAELFLEAKSLLEEAGLGGQYAYASVLNNLSLVYQETGRYDEAFDLALRAIDTMKGLGGVGQETAVSLNNLASIAIARNDWDQAERFVGAALEIFEGMPSPDPHRAAALATKGMIHFQRKEYREALDSFEAARALTGKFFGENIDYAVAERSLAAVYEAMGDNGSAIAHQRAALKITERILGQGHERPAKYRAILERLQS